MTDVHRQPAVSRRQCLIAAFAALAGPVAQGATAGPNRPVVPAPLQRLRQWSGTVRRLVLKYQQNPLRAARAFAYAQVALREAWHAAAPAGSAGDPAGAELAAHRAAARMLELLYPLETPGAFEARFAWLQAACGATGAAARDAIERGEAVAAVLQARCLRDGAGRVWPPRARPAHFPGAWVPTWPLFAAQPAEGMAGSWRTWVPPSPGRHDPPPPPRPGSERHAAETAEVLAAARALTEAQRRAAESWHLDAGSVTPAGVWMDLALEALAQAPGPDGAAPDPALGGPVATACGHDLDVLACVAIAMLDAFVACWRVKMRDWSERPITAVRRSLDPAFEPLLVTPGFPAYVSGHATVSAAAARVLGHWRPEQAARFDALAEEAAMSRLWGGLHFRSDNDEGLALGRSVADDVLATWAAGPRLL